MEEVKHLQHEDIKWLIREFASMADYHVVQRQKDSLCSMITMALNHSLVDKELAIVQLGKSKDVIDFLIDDLKEMIKEKKEREERKNKPIQEELPNVKDKSNGNP
jgi:hypothetical protein